MPVDKYRYFARDIDSFSEWTAYGSMAIKECNFHNMMSRYMKEDSGIEYKVVDQVRKEEPKPNVYFDYGPAFLDEEIL
jgi:hypothetical protein